MLCLSKNEYIRKTKILCTQVFSSFSLLHSSKAMKPLPIFRCLAFTGGAFGIANAVCAFMD